MVDDGWERTQHDNVVAQCGVQSEAAVADLGHPPNVLHWVDVLRGEEAALAAACAAHILQTLLRARYLVDHFR